MKKYLFTLLFMAVALIGAVTVASCGDDDFENSANKRYTFVVEAKLRTTKSEFKDEVAQKENDVNASLNRLFIAAELDRPMTTGQASIAWMNFINKFNSDHQAEADKQGVYYGDRDFTLTVTMRIKGSTEDFQTKTYKPNPLLFL